MTNYWISGAISLGVSLLVSGLFAPWISAKFANKNRKRAVADKDTIDAIDDFIEVIQEADQYRFQSAVVTLIFRRETDFKDKKANTKFVKENMECFIGLEDEDRKLNIVWSKYKVHFDGELGNKIQEYCDKVDDLNSTIKIIVDQIQENGKIKGKFNIALDNFRADQLIGMLYEKRQDLVGDN
ncbi:hypothetical protein [Levilactobacillus brevis]